MKFTNFFSRPSIKNQLTQEQLKVLRAISRNDLDYQNLIHADVGKVKRWIEQYLQRRPVIDDLNKVGVIVKDLDHLVSPSYKENELLFNSIPVLIKWLKKRTLPCHVKTTIARLLINLPVLKTEAIRVFFRVYPKVNCNLRDDLNNGDQLCQFLENGLVFWIDDFYADKLFKMIGGNKHKWRVLLYLAFTKFKKAENRKKAINFLTDRLAECLDRKDGYATVPLEVLRKLKAKETTGLIRRFLQHQNADVRSEAKKTIKSFEKLTLKYDEVFEH